MGDEAGAWVVLTAAGMGTRLGADGPKALVRIGDRTILEFALERALACPDVTGVVVTCPEGLEAEFEAATSAVGRAVPVLFVAGGETRQASVLAGLRAVQERAVPGPETPVLVHDAARCLTPPEVFSRLVAAIRGGADAAIPVLPVVDTIAVVGQATDEDPVGAGASGWRVQETLDRSRLRVVQTPQAFRWDVLFPVHLAAEARSGAEESAATDDASLVAERGIPVQVVEGSPLALKVTVPEDLDRALRFLD